MPFISAIFGCCEPNQKSLAAGAEVRRARIIAVYDQNRAASLQSIERQASLQPPPKYSDAIQDRTVFIPVDEKNPSLFEERNPNIQMIQRPSSPAPTFSDESSVVSIPSTRYSGLTSTYTGDTSRRTGRRRDTTTDRQRDSWRISTFSEWSNNPPSYYASSEDGQDSHMGEAHPVMQDGWLERLRLEAETRTRENAT